MQSPRGPSQHNALLCSSERSESFQLRDASSLQSSKVSRLPCYPSRAPCMSLRLYPGPCFCSVYLKVPGGWPSRFERGGNQAQTHAEVGTPDRGPEARQWPGVSQESEWWYVQVEHAGEMEEKLRAQKITGWKTVTRVGTRGLLAFPSSRTKAINV